MKILIIVAVLLVGCEKKDISDTVNSTSKKQESLITNTIPSDMVNASYSDSECIAVDRGFMTMRISFNENQMRLTTIYHSNASCTGVGFDRTYTYYDMAGAEISHKLTDYTDMIVDGYQACGLTDLVTGVPYDVDGIDCELSYENAPLLIESIGNDRFRINGEMIIQ